jgi:hypothetical protein
MSVSYQAVHSHTARGSRRVTKNTKIAKTTKKAREEERHAAPPAAACLECRDVRG